MKKKTVVLILLSILAFIVVSVSVFGAVYSLTSTFMRANPEIFSKITNNNETNEINKADETNEGKNEAVLTKEKLESLSDDELEQAIADYIWIYKVKEDYDKEYEITKRLPQEMKYLYATWVLELEVNDGGFISFLDLNKGNFTTEAIAGYRFFGADDQADIVAKAVGAYFKKGQRDFTELNDQFYKNEDKVTDLRVKYIREHLDKFVSE